MKKKLSTIVFWLAIAVVVLGCCIPVSKDSIEKALTATSSTTGKDGAAKTSETPKETGETEATEEKGTDASSEEKESEEKETGESQKKETKEDSGDKERETENDESEPADETPAETEPEETEPSDTEETEPTEETSDTTKSEPVEDPGLSYNEYVKMFKEGDYSLVTPAFKEEMDAYEAFYDEYVDYMRKIYSGSISIMDVYDEYMDIVEKSEEWDAKMEAVDEGSLTSADDAYFLYVTLKVENKLLSIWSSGS